VSEDESKYVLSLEEYINLSNDQIEMMKQLVELQKQQIEELELENKILNEVITITGAI
jgi:hypothetical protein